MDEQLESALEYLKEVEERQARIDLEYQAAMQKFI